MILLSETGIAVYDRINLPLVWFGMEFAERDESA
jgi:hypothetical protein